MAERYEDILSLDKNQWTYGSPIIIEGGMLRYDTVSKRNLLTVNFMNICDTILSEVDLTVYASDEQEENIIEIEHAYMKLHLEPGARFGNNVHLPIEDSEAKTFKLKVTRIVCEEDDSEWIKDEIFEIHPEIEDPQVFGQTMDEEYENKYNECKELIIKEDIESLKKVVDLLDSLIWYKNCEEMYEYAKRKYDVTVRTEKRKKREDERRAVRKQKQKMAFAAIATMAAVAVVIFIIIFITIITPSRKVAQAKEYNKQGEYQKAIDICKSLNGFGSSEDVLKESNYQIGFLAFNKQDYNTAIKYFEGTKGYKGTDNLLSKAYTQAGNALMDEEKFEEALDLYNKSFEEANEDKEKLAARAGIASADYKLGDVTNAWTIIQEVYKADQSYKSAYDEYGYAYATAQLSAGKTDDAQSIFLLVKGYKDSAAQYGKIVYDKAIPVAESGDLAGALKTLKAVKGDYKPAGELYTKMKNFIEASSNWVGTWKMTGGQGQYTIKISTLMYKGDLCLRVVDNYLDYDKIISSKEKVRQISVGSERIVYKLKDVLNYKLIFTRDTAKKIKRTLSYDGASYIRRYKKAK